MLRAKQKIFVKDFYRNYLEMQDQEFRLQVNVLLLEALLRQGHGVVALMFLPAALLSQGWTFILQA